MDGRDGTGRLLLIRRTDNGNWAMPGGAMDPGERLTECTVRETEGETGILCDVTGVVGMYTDPGHAIHCTSDDECRQECSVIFRSRALRGEPRPGNESSQVVRVAPEETATYPVHPSMAMRVRHALDPNGKPHLE